MISFSRNAWQGCDGSRQWSQISGAKDNTAVPVIREWKKKVIQGFGKHKGGNTFPSNLQYFICYRQLQKL